MVCIIFCTETKATTTQKFINNVYNESNIKNSNTLINNTITNLTTKNVKQCSANIISDQEINIGTVSAKGDVIIASDQFIKSILDFSCIQTDEVRTKLINDIVTKLTANLSSSADVDIINKMQANAEAKTESQWLDLSLKSTNTETEVNQSIENNITNIQNKTIENTIKTIVETNISQSFFDSCISKVINKQGFSLKEIKAGGSVNIGIKQEILTETFQKCIQDANIGTEILSDFSNITDLLTKDEFKARTKTEAGAAAKAITTIKGLFDGLFDFGDLGKSLLSWGSVLCLCICCIIIVIIFVYLISKLFSGKQGSFQVSYGRPPQVPLGQPSQSFIPTQVLRSTLGGGSKTLAEGFISKLFKREIPIYSPPTYALKL